MSLSFFIHNPPEILVLPKQIIPDVVIDPLNVKLKPLEICILPLLINPDNDNILA